MEKSFVNQECVYKWLKGTIRGYLSERKSGSILERTIGMIRRGLNYGTIQISKQQLQEILDDNEFSSYRNTQRYTDLIRRCKEENLL